jgi:hypothetical protein
MSAKTFIGRDTMDEEVNKDSDVDVPPTSSRRYEKGHSFTLMQLQIPSDGPDFTLDDMAAEWLTVPDYFEPLILDMPGIKHKCGYRISKSLNLQKWDMVSWPVEHRPQEGDWLFCGPLDQTDPEGVTKRFDVMDQIAFGDIFLEGDNSGRIFYVARSMQNILTDDFFFKYMLDQGPIIFNKYEDGITIFGKKRHLKPKIGDEVPEPAAMETKKRKPT